MGLLDRLAQEKMQKQQKADREAGLPGLIRTSQALQGAFAGDAAKTPTAQGILQSLGSSDPAAREIGLGALANIQNQGQPARLQREREGTLFDLGVKKDEAAIAASNAARRASNFSNLQAGVTARNKAINDIGDDVRSTMQPLTEIVQAGADIENLLASGTVLGGVAAAIRFAKASDPTSSVREGELGTIVGNLGGLMQEWQNTWNRAVNEGLTPETAAQLNKTTRALISQRALDGLAQLEGFTQIARAAQIPDSQIQAILQTARINLPQIVKFAAPAMTPLQIEQWKARLSGQ